MSDNPEPLAAILAEMRGNEFDDPNLDADGIIGARRLARDWADRIEAAAKRERAITDVMLSVKGKWVDHPDPEHAPPLFPGNAAAMREALNDAVRWLSGMLQFCDRRRTGEEIRVPAYSAFGTIDRLRAALSAPARNCDRFQTAEEALAEIEKQLFVWNPTLYSVVQWLFAPAKEGGDHA